MDSDPRSLKIAAARAALELVESGMKLGLGTGSTAEELVRVLADRIRDGGLKGIRTVSTSVATERLAASLGIPVYPLAELPELDLAIDGADEIDPSLRLIKGRGGALLREKIIEQCARRFAVIADETKRVERLGGVPLPIEVVAFAAEILRARFATLGLDPMPRMNGADWFVTDEGHRIIDVRVPGDRDIADLVDELRAHAGVVETGFFPHEATEAYIASAGGVEHLVRG